ncbi:shTK domain protein [Oesophagostomum dentatum]|uniref:ShTK domain protein n=1 Tax=Oesophagostomum dentatum TaxID=61180 RepID=A0A0B1T920_OESDE|nr:shTK domain protein [Oesophagostomum dentatum]
MLVVFLLFYLVTRLNGQSFCDTAPDEGIRDFCYQIQEMDKANRRLEASGTSTLGRVINFRPQTIYDCRNIPCICSFLGGGMRFGACQLGNGRVFGRALRKEYRMLTDDEMRRFVSAMWTIKRSGTYDVLARVHTRFATGTGAHAGPAFLPWHREFTKRVEFALRQVDPSVALPYWDSTLDSNIPNPRQSCLFSDDLLGGAMPGEVRDGAFAGWMLENRARVIRRNIGGRPGPFTENMIAAAVNANSLTTVLAFTAATDVSFLRPFSRCAKVCCKNHGRRRLLGIFQRSVPNICLASAKHSFFQTAGESSCYRGACVNGVCRFVGARMEQREQVTEPTSPAPPFGGGLTTPAPAGNRSCFNDQECCDVWAARGGCQDNSAYMSSFCEASCNVCTPSYDKSVECSDRFPTCRRISNECMTQSRIAWMKENCRRTCGYCTETREEACTTLVIAVLLPGLPPATHNEPRAPKPPGNAPASYQESKFPVPSPPPQTVSPCLNLHFCCSIWAQKSRCGEATMKQFCPVSCDGCGDVDLSDSVGSAECIDNHSKCGMWASSNMCDTKKDFMWENCRLSCGKCDLLDVDKHAAACQNESPVSEEKLPEKLASARTFLSQPLQNTEASTPDCTNY